MKRTHCIVISFTITYNDREKQLNASLIIKMSGNTTYITKPDNKNDSKPFTFDYSYWSHDCYREEKNGYLAATGSEYADQVKLIFVSLDRHARAMCPSADDIRRAIARHHTPKIKLRSRKNCTPRTMYRYKGNT